MDALFFASKRSYYAELRIARELVAPFGLTPARFDLLCALRRSYAPVTLNELRDELGVSKPTLCRMIRSMEDLGFIMRGYVLGDLRLRTVMMTEAGMARMLAVIRSVVDAGYVDVAIESAVAQDRVLGPAARVVVRDTFTRVHDLSVGFGDSADLIYPWDVAA